MQPVPEPEPSGRTDERNLREALRALLPGTLVALAVGALLLLVRHVYAFPAWLSLLVFAVAASAPLTELFAIVGLKWVKRKQR